LWVLKSDNEALRKAASQKGVVIHGTLWLLDAMVRSWRYFERGRIKIPGANEQCRQAAAKEGSIGQNELLEIRRKIAL
jgi:hypothetical protein